MARNKARHPLPAERATFAERLRICREERGFKTARSLAKAMGLDENRYTRYERAEVEPDLQIICKICGTLGVTPNDLLAFSESGQTFTKTAAGVPQCPSDSSADAISMRLAGNMLTFKDEKNNPIHVLAIEKEKSRIFLELQSGSYNLLRQIFLNGSIAKIGSTSKLEISDLIQRLAATLKDEESL